MSADHADTLDHAADAPPAHDLAHEAEHARHHAKDNIKFFAGFFALILCAVGSYELTPNSTWQIMLLGAGRVALMAGFFVWLIGHFSFVVRTFIFTVLFFGGMVILSIWDSTIPKYGDPMANRTPPPKVKIQH